MRYVMSDIHGEYELFLALLDKIGFSDGDEMYIAGDIIDKGHSSVKLARKIFSMPNVHVTMGNHEHSFISYYNFAMRRELMDFPAVLDDLRRYITDGGGDGHLLDWDVVDAMEGLPYYIEEDDFICVHAGVPLDPEGRIPPLATVADELLIADRRFRLPEILPSSGKCVFFGHTATHLVSGEDKIIAYKRGSAFGDIRDYSKVHLDTCTCHSGVLGCFSPDNCTAYYVQRSKR